MGSLLDRIRRLVESGDYRFSAHAVQELAKDDIPMAAATSTPERWLIVEEYPEYHAGPCILVLQQNQDTDVVLHLLWGIPAGYDRPAVLVTAYRPDASKWTADFLKRIAP